MRSLHICYVENGYPHAHGGGGAGTYVQLVGRELVRQGHRVSVIAAPCRGCPVVSRDEGVVVYRPSRSALHWYAGRLPLLRAFVLTLRYLEVGWSIYRQLEELHRREPIDLVEFTEGGNFWHAWQAPFPYVVHLHGSRYTFLRMAGQPTPPSERLCRLLELAFIRRARLVVSPSQAMLDLVRAEARTCFDCTDVIPYPIDPNLLQSYAVNGNTSGSMVMFAARNDPVKGVTTLLRAIPLVQQVLPHTTFELFGPELDHSEVCNPNLRVHSFKSRAQLLHYYRQATLCVIPSYWDNSPNTIYEAMAAGKAVVASAVGGIPELVIDGETGLLVPPQDPQRLAHAITQLLSDEATCRQMGQRGRDRITQLADLARNLEHRLKLYRCYVATL